MSALEEYEKKGEIQEGGIKQENKQNIGVKKEEENKITQLLFILKLKKKNYKIFDLLLIKMLFSF